MATRTAKARTAHTPLAFHATCRPYRPGQHEGDAVLSFADPVAYEQHMTAVHGAKAPKTPAAKPYRAPKPGNGEFTPKPDAPGARISWTQWIDGQQVTRSGQIWSAAPGGRCCWVVPDDRDEDEMAVRIRIEADGQTHCLGYYSRAVGTERYAR